MANDRKYRVLAALPATDREAGELPGHDYRDLGDHASNDAEGAIEAALASVGPAQAEKVTNAIAIPVGNWNLCDVEVETQPRYRATRVVGTPATPAEGAPEQADPEPGEPAEEDPAA